MIDGGPPDQVESFKKMLPQFSIRPEEIKLIILTHGDFDHIGSVKDIRELTGAKIAIHERDKINLEQGILNWPPGASAWGKVVRFMLMPFFKNSILPTIKTDFVLGEKEFPLNDFGIDGKILYTPGHTPGSVSVLLNTGEAFVGCLAHNNFPFRFRPGLPIFAENLEKVKESWKLIIEHGARMIYPAHGDPFPVEAIKKYLN
jgi:glyoxylase-like metal-dependent hydrolase (beta-lactamase superfamily II)